MIDDGLKIRDIPDGIEVRVHAQPRARRAAITGIHDGALKIRIMEPPVDDAANRAIVKFFASLLGTSKSSVRITSGLKSKEKTLQIQGMTQREFISRLHLD